MAGLSLLVALEVVGSMPGVDLSYIFFLSFLSAHGRVLKQVPYVGATLLILLLKCSAVQLEAIPL